MLPFDTDCSHHAVVIRHCERLDSVDENWQKKYPMYPLDDCPLSRKGYLQAKEIAEELAEFKARAVFVSPYERCIRSIAPASIQHQWHLKLEPGIGEILDETNYPPHYLYPFSIVKYFNEVKFDKKYVPVKKAFSLKPEMTVTQCEKRVRYVIDQIMMTYGCKGIVFVTHRYICNMITSMYTGESLRFEPGTMAFIKSVNKRWVIDYVIQT